MYVLKFISGKYQGGEFPLLPGRQHIIGRSPELELALVEDMVSRKHAKLSVSDDGRITIEDLGSSNGTFVNGEQIARPMRLKDGDRILIGTSILKVVKAEDGASQAGSVPAQRPALDAVSRAAAQRKTSMPSSVTGRIEELAISDLLQLFATSRKNGVLALRNSSGEEGYIYLRQGRIYYARMTSAPACGPLKCFRRILRWTSGDFELLPPDASVFPDEISASTESLLSDARGELNEMGRLTARLPLSAKIRPVRPLEKPLRALSGPQLDAFQVVYNHIGTVQQALDSSAAADFETLQQLISLVDSGYLQRA